MSIMLVRGGRKFARTRKVSPWLRATLIESARAASRSKGTCLGERYRRLARRRGDKKAIIAIAHEILTASWHMLNTGEVYREQGPTIVSERDADNARRRAIRQLERLGTRSPSDRSGRLPDPTAQQSFSEQWAVRERCA
jgi:transposase